MTTTPPARRAAARPSSARPRKARPTGRVPLRFAAPAASADTPLHADLSTVAASSGGRFLWLASDETTRLERLEALYDEKGALIGYGNHCAFDLAELLDLPEKDGTEIDIEGLTLDGGYLWIAGSHSLARKRPKPGENGPDEALERLTRVKHEANRFLIARVPLVREGREGRDELQRTAAGIDNGGGTRRAARMKIRKGRNSLVKALADDVHFGRFLDVPAKENGFDVEGIAVDGNRVLLGLRGPVLRGWAVAVDIAVRETKKGWLKLDDLDGAPGRYRKHFLDLGGLGIRALMREGDDIVILAGPTMDLDGPVRLYRWRDPWHHLEDSIVTAPRVERIAELPHGAGCDHAEGIARIAQGAGKADKWMVVHDGPAPSRLLPDGRGAAADLFSML